MRLSSPTHSPQHTARPPARIHLEMNLDCRKGAVACVGVLGSDMELMTSHSDSFGGWRGRGGAALEKKNEVVLLQQTTENPAMETGTHKRERVCAGELGCENDPGIMRINNHICSWPFSLLFSPESNESRRSP